MCDPPEQDECPTTSAGSAGGIELQPAIPGQEPVASPATQEAEISSIIAPDGAEYVVSQLIDWDERVGALPDEPSNCIVQKGLGVYYRPTPSDDFVAIPIEDEGSPGVESFHINVGASTGLKWYTDPYLSVGPETGVVYLSAMKWPGYDAHNCDASQLTVTDDFDEEIQLWAIRENNGEKVLKKVGVNPAGESLISLGLNRSFSGGNGALDRTHVASHSVDGSTDRVVVVFSSPVPHPLLGDGTNRRPDRFVTFVCTWGGQNDGCEVEDLPFSPGAQPYVYDTGSTRHPNIRFDHRGALYVAYIGSSSKATVKKMEWDDAPGQKKWVEVDTGAPELLNPQGLNHILKTENDGPGINTEPAPAIAVGKLGNASEPVVWLAWTTIDESSGDLGVEISAGRGDDLSEWLSTVPLPHFADITGRSNNFSASISVNGDRDILDVVHYVTIPTVKDDPNDPNSPFYNLTFDASIWARVSRFRAHDLKYVDQEDIGFEEALRPNELPGRSPANSAGVFLGEYFGISTHQDGRGIVAWNRQVEVVGGDRRSDLYVTEFSSICAAGITLGNGLGGSDSLRANCATPSTAIVELSTFGSSLTTLCRAFPLCAAVPNISLDFTAVLVESNGQRPPAGGEVALGDGTFTVEAGEVTNSTESIDEPLGAGEHVVKLCVHDNVSHAELGCVEQDVKVEGPFGSGPDSVGHFAGKIPLDFVNLSALTGASTHSVTSDGVVRVPLPSSLGFTYYGTAVSEVLVGANGGIRFSTGAIPATNSSFPTTTSSPHVAVFWDDLDPSVAGSVLTFFDGRRFIVSWEAVRHVASGANVSVQAHLYPGGRVELHYLDTDVGNAAYDDGASATIGMQSGSNAVLVSYNSASALAATRAIAIDDSECIGAPFIIPASVACSAPDIGVTSCASYGLEVIIPEPDVSACAPDAVTLEGRVTHYGVSRDQQDPLREPLRIVNGGVVLESGVYTVEWIPRTSYGTRAGSSFVQIIYMAQWANATNCCSTCFASEDTIFLSAESDTLQGAVSGECILAGDGGDTINGGGGGDRIIGGFDDDDITTHEGDDVLICEDGDDIGFGGAGADLFDGGAGADALAGEGDDDRLDGGAGDDVLSGGDGADILRGRSGSDVLLGGDGSDRLYPGSGVDSVFADGGDDSIYLLATCELNAGKAISGGAGYDTLFVPSGVTLVDLTAAGVVVDADVEAVVESVEPEHHLSDCG